MKHPSVHPRFRGVIFDMDGVLCDSEPFICEAATRMFAERYGLTVCREDFVPFVGAGENRYLGGVAEKYDVRLDLEPDKKRTYDLYLQIIRGRLQPLAGVREFLADCRQLAMLAAVATSADEVKMCGNLTEIGLPAETFDVTVNGLEVVHKKPDPEIFLLAIERLGLPPGDCLVAVATESYHRAVADAKELIRSRREWVAECRRRLKSLGGDRERLVPDMSQR